MLARSWLRALRSSRRTPAEIIERRENERDLFFDGKWSNDGRATVYQVLKPSYQPNFRKPARIDISRELAVVA